MTLILPGRVRRRSVLSLIAAAAAVPSCQAEAQDPLPREHRSDTCSVTTETQSPDDVRVEEIVGEFAVVMHVTDNVRRDSLVRGRMVLKPRSPESPGADRTLVPWMVWGWTSLPAHRVGDIPLSGPLSSDDPARPGIHGYWSSGRQSFTLMLNQTKPDSAFTLDAGILMEVLATDSDGFRGTWVAGSIPPAPSGYYCARRVGTGERF